MTFTDLYNRLITEVLVRINSGDITERGLARVVGVSQPQIHNVLKGKRRLQPVLADRLLEKFNLDLLELLQIEKSVVLSGNLETTDLSSAQLLARKGPGREKLPYRSSGRSAAS